MRISLGVRAVEVLAALAVISGVGAHGEIGGASTQKAGGVQPATQAGGRVESLAEVKAKFLLRLGKLQNFSATFSRDDLYPSMKGEDHWDCEARFKAGVMWNKDVRVKAEGTKYAIYAGVDRLEKWIYSAPKKPKSVGGLEELDVLTPAGGGEVEAVTGPAYGYLEQQGLDLFEALGVVWQGSFEPVKAAELSKPLSTTMGEIGTTWSRLDEDRVTITATDPGSRGNKRTLTLDRRFGYAVVEARSDWDKSKDYDLLTASDFVDAGNGVMVPMTITTLHRGQDCHSDYDAIRNTYHMKEWVLNDAKNTADAMKAAVPKGVKAVDRKEWTEKYVQALSKRPRG